MMNFSFFIIVQLLSCSTAVEFLVRPTSEAVAPNSQARFNCAVEGDDSTYVFWKFKEYEIKSHSESESEMYNASWYGEPKHNTSLDIRTDHIELVNASEVVCIATTGGMRVNNTAIVVIAGEPMAPDDLVVHYNSTETTVALHWSRPFTHMPNFPILSYTVDLEYYKFDVTASKTATIDIKGMETNYLIHLNESEVCTSKRLCITLRARNGIGYSSRTKHNCIDIKREHHPFPINTNLTVQPDGSTLIVVAFQTPQCFPQGMQPKVMVEEAPTQDAEITTVPAPVEGNEPMRTHTVFRMKQDVVYSVTLQLSSKSENTSSQPAFVMLSAPDDPIIGVEGGEEDVQVNIIAVVVGVVILAVFVITGLATCVTILIRVQRRRKKSNLPNNGMHPNPLYENTLYETIPESLTLPRYQSYDSHIYQDMPDLVRRLQANNEIFLVSGEGSAESCTATESSEEAVEEGKGQCTVLGEERVVERESDYVVMQSVTDVPSPLATDV